MDHDTVRDETVRSEVALACPDVTVYCPDCATTVVAELPPCADGHGAACPDRACSRCGAALITDGVLVELARARRRRRGGRRDAA